MCAFIFQVQSPSSSSSLPRNAETVDDDLKSWNYQNLSQVPLRQSSEDSKFLSVRNHYVLYTLQLLLP